MSGFLDRLIESILDNIFGEDDREEEVGFGQFGYGEIPYGGIDLSDRIRTWYGSEDYGKLYDD